MERSLPSLKAHSSDRNDLDYLNELKHDVLENKKHVNTLQQQNVVLTTRMKTVEKEVNRRTRLLKELWSLSKSDQPLTRELITRLGDERSGLPLYRQRCNMLEEALGDREEEISDLKHKETFTKIVELEGALAALRSEASRLQSLCEEPSPELNKAAESEIQAYQGLFETLEKEVANLERQRVSQIEDISDKQEDYQVHSTTLRKTEDELGSVKQELDTATRKCHALEEETKTKRELFQDLECLMAKEATADNDIQALQEAIEQLTRDSNRGRYTMTVETFSALGNDIVKLLGRIRCRWTAKSLDSPHTSTLLCQLLEANQSGDGKLSADEIYQIVRRLGLSVHLDEITSAVSKLSPDGGSTCNLLDFFIACLLAPPDYSLAGPSDEQLKDLAGRMSYETFRTRLLQVEDSTEIAAIVGDSAYWVHLWEVYGVGGVLLNVPAWEPQSTVLKLRLLDSWENSHLEKALRASQVIEGREQLESLLAAACPDDFYSPTDIGEIMSMYAGAPDLRLALLESLA